MKNNKTRIDIDYKYTIGLGATKSKPAFGGALLGMRLLNDGNPTYKFETEEELTVFLAQLKNVKHDAKDQCASNNIDNDIIKEEENPLPKIDYERNLKNYNQWLNEMKLRQEKSQGNKSTNAASLNISMSDGDLVGTGPNNKYLEFTIFASSDEYGTYLDNAAFHLLYNSNKFGSNIVANGNVSITRLGSFNTLSYIDPNNYMFDDTPNTFAFGIGSPNNYSPLNRVLLTTIPTPILKIKIRITNCSGNANIEFTNEIQTSVVSYYTTSANDDILDAIQYSNTNYVGNIFDNPCVPIINLFNDHISAGTGDVLTIQGNYFGDKMLDASTVVFYDANKGFTYPDTLGIKKGGIQHYDVIYWSDNQIDIKMPSMIDSVSNNVNDPSSFINVVPGSGKFKVLNFTGTEAEIHSTLTLNIDYAVMQKRFIDPDLTFGAYYSKLSTKLAAPTNSGKYIIYCDPLVEATYPGAKNIIKRAMMDWTCVTGINWELGNDSIIGVAQDNYCTISLFSDTKPGMKTDLHRLTCIDILNQPNENMHSFDIQINTQYLWQVDNQNVDLAAGKADFYALISHELGHAHGVDHINNLADVMFWGFPVGPTNKAVRQRVWFSAGASAAGVWVANNTKNVICGETNSHILTILDTEDCLGVSVEENEATSKIKVYPNPVQSDYIYIDLDLTQAENVNFALYNVNGQMLQRTNNLINTGKVTEMLYIGNLPTGMYLLQVNMGSESHQIKLIVNN